nr:unnamed protein product [Callosobruchus chinensis]CAH7746796.1 unnamed protein product [Callosobruchus chinensis]
MLILMLLKIAYLL